MPRSQLGGGQEREGPRRREGGREGSAGASGLGLRAVGVDTAPSVPGSGPGVGSPLRLRRLPRASASYPPLRLAALLSRSFRRASVLSSSQAGVLPSSTPGALIAPRWPSPPCVFPARPAVVTGARLGAALPFWWPRARPRGAPGTDPLSTPADTPGAPALCQRPKAAWGLPCADCAWWPGVFTDSVHRCSRESPRFVLASPARWPENSGFKVTRT